MLTKSDMDAAESAGMRGWMKKLAQEIKTRYGAKELNGVRLTADRGEVKEIIRQRFPLVNVPEWKGFYYVALLREYAGKQGIRI